MQGVNDEVGAGDVTGLNKSADPLQSALRVDDEAQITQAHERAQDPSSSVDGHPPPGEKANEMHKVPYLVRQLSVFFLLPSSDSHRLRV